MFVEGVLEQYEPKSVFAVGCLLGAGVGATLGIVFQIISLQIGEFSLRVTRNAWGNASTNVLDAKPTYSLRLIQAIGILLPLFTGLLRFTTNNESAVSERTNDYLLLGVLGLVFGGVFAAIGGITADTAVILKVALIIVIFTFTLIGLAAMVMLKEMTASEDEWSEIQTNSKDTERGIEDSEPEESTSEDVSDSTTEPDSPAEEDGETEPEQDETGQDET